MADLSGQTLGKYQIIERLGRGGMATVYRAYQPGMDRFVAVKVMHPQYADDASFIERFRREARVVGTLRHPHIVQVIDFDVQDEEYYMVMEYVETETLKNHLQKHGAMPVSQALSVARKLADALAYAHANGMLHRDIKPANVLWSKTGEPILTDFGIAKLAGATGLTASGAAVGTPAYMSPEAGRGEQVDERADVYSLGVMLYEMLSGELPYDADTPYAVILKHINDPLPPLRPRVPHLPEGIERIVIKALAKDKTQRYQSAAELRDALVQAEKVAHEIGTAEDTVDLAPSAGKSPETILLPERRSVLPFVLGVGVLIGIGLLASTLISSPSGLFVAAAPSATFSATPTAFPTLTLTATATPTRRDEIVAAPPATATMDLPTAIAAAANDPQHAELTAKVRELISNGSLEAALETSQAALANDPQNYDLLALNAWVLVQFRSQRERLETGKQNAEQAIGQDAKRPEAYIPLGFYHHYSPIDDRPRAVMFYTLAIERGSQDSAVYLLRALALEDVQENNPQKEADFSRAIELAPKDDELRIVRGNFYYQTQRYGDAVRDYEESLRLRPELWKHPQMAAAYLLNKQPSEALALFTNATTITTQEPNPALSDAQYLGQASYVAWVTNQPALAAEWSAAAQKVEPNNALAAYTQALLARDGGNYAEALDKLAIVRAEPEAWKYEAPFFNPHFDHQLDADEGRVLALLGRADEAIAAYDRAKEATYLWGTPYVEQAALYFARGEREKAQENIRTALSFPYAEQNAEWRAYLESLLAAYSATLTPTLTPTATRTPIPSTATIQPTVQPTAPRPAVISTARPTAPRLATPSGGSGGGGDDDDDDD
jgi:serine/threonine protein kinase/tetratricopeptide (TPR) repeat protein